VVFHGSEISTYSQVDTERPYIFAQLNHLIYVVPWLGIEAILPWR
jgi:hypothetical protein